MAKKRRKALTKARPRPVPEKKEPVCEIKHAFMCNGSGLQHLQGVRAGDPKFYACMGCVVWLRCNKVKFKGAE